MASTVDWSNLPPELMELILDRLTRLSDHLHFASICSSWRSVAINYRRHHHLPCQLPLLMLHDDNNTVTRHFFSLSSGEIYGIHIPEIKRMWCCGSSEGWLIAVDGDTGEIQLFNPFSRGCIQLPSFSTFSYPQFKFDYPRYIQKVILSANPSRTSGFIVVAIVTSAGVLAYYKPGADRWITIEMPWICFEDVIYYKGLFYAVSINGPVVAYDFSSETPILMEITGERGRTCDSYYLVESLGELLLVVRQCRRDNNEDNYRGFGKPLYKTFTFQVRRLDESKREWIQMESIGNRILFLGNSCSISLPSQDFLERKGNSIYFIDDYDNVSYCHESYDQLINYPDIGVFNFENGSVESFFEPPPILSVSTFRIALEPW